MFGIYYASDIHGSSRLWRKFINAGRFYGVDALVMGGDITGKAVVPIVETSRGFLAEHVAGERLFHEDELDAVESRIRDLGFYPYRIPEAEFEAIRADPARMSEVFRQAMKDSLQGWLGFAEERLHDSHIRLYVMLGNDDEPYLREVIAASPLAVDSEGVVIELGEGFQMLSYGYSNPTPWSAPREVSEDELERRLESLVSDLNDPSRSVFNLHVPPIRTSLDQAPELDQNLKPTVRGGSVLMTAAGSVAVRNVIERHQPLLALHGHIHESRGIAKLGRTVCINPGSEYGEGHLHGALVSLDKKKGLANYQLVSG
jgi:Icc-related predicted phosphoesterase